MVDKEISSEESNASGKLKKESKEGREADKSERKAEIMNKVQKRNKTREGIQRRKTKEGGQKTKEKGRTKDAEAMSKENRSKEYQLRCI